MNSNARSSISYDSSQLPFHSRVSLVIPIGPGDLSWSPLLEDFGDLPAEVQFIFVCPASISELCGPNLALKLQQFQQSRPRQCVYWLTPDQAGRAMQLNTGAMASGRDFFWFIHADSRLGENCWKELEKSVLAHPADLHYFRLGFLADGPLGMKVNSFGAAFRSRFLGMPFGDQGFCLSRKLFKKVGMFNEELLFGEDHELVWKVRLQGAALRRVPATLLTSARRYREEGWFSTTARHLHFTFKQAFPFWKRLQVQRLGYVWKILGSPFRFLLKHRA